MSANLEQQPQIEPAVETRYTVPRVSIFEDKDGYLLEAEMPGVGKDGLEITLEGNELVFVGRRSEDKADGKLLYRERRGWDYRRAFELDPAIETSRINAKMDQGVLTLRLPKAEKVKPRRIEITG